MKRSSERLSLFYARIVVPGGTVFPIDMLRYDNCVPLHEPDANAITYTFTGGEQRHLYVKKYAEPNASWTSVWTPDRWKSFGVTCHPLIEKPDGLAV